MRFAFAMLAFAALPFYQAGAQSESPRRTHLHGAVVDESGRPLDGAIVDIGWPSPPKGAGDMYAQVITDSLGHFYFDSAATHAYLRVRSLGYRTHIAKMALRSPNARLVVRMRRDEKFARDCTHLCDLLFHRATASQLSEREGGVRAADPSANDSEIAAVYSAVIDSVYHVHGITPRLIVVADSTQGFIRFCSHRGPCELPDHRSRLDSSLLTGLHQVIYAPASHRFSDPLPAIHARIPVVFQSDADRDEIFRIGAELGSGAYRPGDRDMTAFDRAFHQLYPGAWGTLMLSRVGFDSTRTQALLQMWHRCGGNCSTVEIVYLRKTRGAWRIWERMRAPMYNSEGWSSAPLRYIGEDGWRRRATDLRRDSASVARLDSIRLTHAPRRIIGTITNSATHSPVAFAEVAVHSAPNDHVRMVRADRDGRFTIMNPPIGGTMIEVRCPGSRYVRSLPTIYGDNRTLGVPSLYVRAGLDTAVAITIPSLASCTEPLHIERAPKPAKVVATRPSPPRPQGKIVGEVKDLAGGEPVLANIHVRGFTFLPTDSMGRFQVWYVPVGSYKIDVVCPTVNRFLGAATDSATVNVGKDSVTSVDLRLDRAKCTGKPLYSRTMTMRGHWSLAFEDGFFTPCRDLGLPSPLDRQGVVYGSAHYFTVDFAGTDEMKRFKLPDVKRRDNGGFLYYVEWTATVEGPGWFGHMGLAAYRLTVSSVAVARDASATDCQDDATH